MLSWLLEEEQSLDVGTAVCIRTSPAIGSCPRLSDLRQHTNLHDDRKYGI